MLENNTNPQHHKCQFPHASNNILNLQSLAHRVTDITHRKAEAAWTVPTPGWTSAGTHFCHTWATGDHQATAPAHVSYSSPPPPCCYCCYSGCCWGSWICWNWQHIPLSIPILLLLSLVALRIPLRLSQLAAAPRSPSHPAPSTSPWLSSRIGALFGGDSLRRASDWFLCNECGSPRRCGEVFGVQWSYGDERERERDVEVGEWGGLLDDIKGCWMRGS